MGVIETIELSELREYLRRRVAEEKRSAAADRDQPTEPGPPPSNGSRIDELIAEGKVKPPRRRRPVGEPLPEPLQPFGKVDELERASRALDYVRGDR